MGRRLSVMPSLIQYQFMRQHSWKGNNLLPYLLILRDLIVLISEVPKKTVEVARQAEPRSLDME